MKATITNNDDTETVFGNVMSINYNASDCFLSLGYAIDADTHVKEYPSGQWKSAAFDPTSTDYSLPKQPIK
jgi:hypothetical protein